MRIHLVPRVVCAVLLAACTSLQTQPRAPTATAIPVPSLASAQVFILTPNAAPTLTVTAPAPTSAPTTTPADTATPVAPVEGTPAPTGTATATNSLQSAPASTCDNAFYPVSLDTYWQYRVSSDTTSSYDKTITRLVPDSFTERRVFAATATDNTWTCTPDGLLSKQFGNLQIHGQTQYKFDTTDSEGITIPPADRWFVGNAWSNRYAIAGQVDQSGIPISGTGAVTLANRIAAEEQVTVPAGTFLAFRVDSTIGLKLTPSGLFPIPVNLTLSQSSWYARDTGMIKSTLTMNGQTAAAELLSYTP